MDPPPLEALAPFERFAVRCAARMNRGRWQRACFWGARHIGAAWITALTGPLLRVEGLEHVAATSRARPLVVVANHRTYFDLYVVMAVLFDRLPGWRAINFPVRGRYFYQSPGGMAVNALAAWWSMYPPFFYQDPKKRRFEQWALGELVAMCREGEGRLVGFHPEGTRNKGDDPWSLLPPQPGIGRLILEARPQVVPVFIGAPPTGIGDLIARRRRGGAPIRLRFGPALDYSGFLDRPNVGRTHREVAGYVMERIAALAALDRAEDGGSAGASA